MNSANAPIDPLEHQRQTSRATLIGEFKRMIATTRQRQATNSPLRLKDVDQKGVQGCLQPLADPLVLNASICCHAICRVVELIKLLIVIMRWYRPGSRTFNCNTINRDAIEAVLCDIDSADALVVRNKPQLSSGSPSSASDYLLFNSDLEFSDSSSCMRDPNARAARTGARSKRILTSAEAIRHHRTHSRPNLRTACRLRSADLKSPACSHLLKPKACRNPFGWHRMPSPIKRLTTHSANQIMCGFAATPLRAYRLSSEISRYGAT